MSDLLENNSTARLTWRYYARDTGSLWTAPNAVSHICGGNDGHGNCTGTEFTSYVSLPPPLGQTDSMAPILEDIENCNLPAVSWVIPDGTWSDHPGRGTGILGPPWVAAIVNAVGGPRSNPCPGGENYWNDTVIFVVWDDWGGWYDHVLPYRCDNSGTCLGYPLNGGGNQYVYGFRVPLLVVSAYNKHTTNGLQGFTGYISGTQGQGGEIQPYIHDFGSILNFNEYAFGADGHFLTLPNALISGINPDYPYADYWAPDGPQACTTCLYSLRDFFDSDFGNPPTTFTPIQIPDPTKDAEFFENYAKCCGGSGR